MTFQPNRNVVVDAVGRLPQFSHATVAGDLIFVSGTLGTLGQSFELAEGGTGPQTEQTLDSFPDLWFGQHVSRCKRITQNLE